MLLCVTPDDDGEGWYPMPLPFDPSKNLNNNGEHRAYGKSSDGTYDEPYDGLVLALERETLSYKELNRLRFIRWSRKRRNPHYSEE